MKRFVKILLIVLAALNFLIITSGSTYLYRALYYSFANIDDYKIFDNNIVFAQNAQLWGLGTNYNKQNISDEFKKSLEELETVSFLIIKDDSIRTEYYWDNYSDTSFSNSFSVAKSMINILIGIALKEKTIASIDEPVGKYIPEFNTELKKGITIKHLLQMSSGLKWNETYTNPFSVTTKAYYGKDLYNLVSHLPTEAAPGKTFNYQSCNTQLLGIILQKATGKSISQYTSEKLWNAIGAEHNALWSTDRNEGAEKAFCCFNTNARNFARIGKLYLQKGNWNGRQIVDTAFVESSIKPNGLINTDGSPNKKYGLHWWCINRNGFDIFYARGHLGQYIFCIPDKNMIVVRLGHHRGEKTDDGHTTDIHLYIDESLKMYP